MVDIYATSLQQPSDDDSNPHPKQVNVPDQVGKAELTTYSQFFGFAEVIGASKGKQLKG